VGRGGKNAAADVAIIQTALNDQAKAGLKIDGKCGSETIKAILAYQKTIGLPRPDGLVEPGKPTIAGLAGAAKPGAKPGAPAAPDGGAATDTPKGPQATKGPAKAAPPEAEAPAPAPAADAKKPLPVPQISVKPGGEVSALMSLAASLDSITPIKGSFPDGAHYTMTIGGKSAEINQQEADTNRKNAQAAFAKAAKSAQALAATAQENYNDYRKTMRTGMFDRAATFLFDTFTVTDPGGSVQILVVLANTQAQAATIAANGNSFVVAAKSLIAADGAAHKAEALLWAYKDGLESSAGGTVTVLKGVKLACELTLAVGGAVATGGAATVAFAGGVGITAADDLAPAIIGGKKIDWGKFAFDMALAFAMKKLAPGEQMEKAVIAKLASTTGEKLSEKVAKEAFAKLAGAAYESLLKKTLEGTQKVLSGKEVTWDEFVEDAKKDLIKDFAIELGKAMFKK
jgi:hypothetical protein